jgi:hypothetical protein
MGFVENGSFPGNLRTPIAPPGERGIDDPALRHEFRAIALVERQVLFLRTDRVAVEGIMPRKLADELLGIWIEEQLVGIEAMARARFVGAMYPIRIDCPRPGVWKIPVPDLVRVFRQFDARDLTATVDIEEAKLDLGRVAGKDCEIDPQSVPSGSEREGQTLADPTPAAELPARGRRLLWRALGI